MAQEFTIKSQDIEDKINQLLPSQGGFGAGVDFSASTMVIPIVDLTETAEGSALRQDLQSAISFNQATTFNVSNTTTTVLNTTGYYRIFGNSSLTVTATAEKAEFILNDGTTDKTIYAVDVDNLTVETPVTVNFDFIIKLGAGDSFKISAGLRTNVVGSLRQIADLSGNLINP